MWIAIAEKVDKVMEDSLGLGIHKIILSCLIKTGVIIFYIESNKTFKTATVSYLSKIL
jgi:hypothetical protein